jgi:hypothetical protein
MKKTLITLLILTLSILSFSQKCKFDFDQTDQFTGQTSKGFDLTISGAWKTRLTLMDDQFYISFLIALPGRTDYTSSKGDSCLLVLEDGKKLILFSDLDALPNTDVANSGTSYADLRTYYALLYKMTDVQMRQLSKSPIKAMRIYLNDMPVTLDVIPEKNTKKIVSAADCLIKEY